MKKIIIVCAGSLGKEVWGTINSINKVSLRDKGEEQYQILGFIDDNPNALDGSSVTAQIIGSIANWRPEGDEVYALGAASAASKRKIVSMLKERGCRFETIVAPWTHISGGCEIGEGCFITAYSISAGAKIGNFASINGSMICAGAVIGDYSITTGFSVVEDAVIGEDVFIGSHAVVQSGIHVGNSAKISAGSIVCEDVAPEAIVFGVPAAVIG